MTEKKTDNASKEISVKEFTAKQKDDRSWVKEPWIDQEDGYEYRQQRVKNDDGTYTVFTARIGKEPRIKKG